MKKVKITADLELKSELGIITVQNRDEDLLIYISSASAVIYPLRVYLGLKRYLPYSEYVNQKITVVISDNKIMVIENGKLDYLKKWWAFKFLLKSIIRKGI